MATSRVPGSVVASSGAHPAAAAGADVPGEAVGSVVGEVVVLMPPTSASRLAGRSRRLAHPASGCQGDASGGAEPARVDHDRQEHQP
jgi:hypothetical protein